MGGSIYKIIEIVGTSKTSWEDAAKTAVENAAKTLEDLRLGEVVKLDATIDENKLTSSARGLRSPSSITATNDFNRPVPHRHRSSKSMGLGPPPLKPFLQNKNFPKTCILQNGTGTTSPTAWLCRPHRFLSFPYTPARNKRELPVFQRTGAEGILNRSDPPRVGLLRGREQ